LGVPATVARDPDLTEDEVEAIKATMAQADADNTKRAYTAAWRSFTDWCERRGATPLPCTPVTLAAYLRLATQRDGSPYTVSSLSLHLSAIKRAHRTWNLAAPTEHPYVYQTWRGLRRERGTHQQGATALTADLLRKVVAGIPPGVQGMRDRALLLVGFAGAFRRSELVALRLCDVRLLPEGVRLRVERRKTGDEPVWLDFRRSGGLYCPVDALGDYIDALAASDTPLSIAEGGRGTALWRQHGTGAGGLSAGSVRLVVRRACDRVGLDPDLFSAHSLRSGFATSAAESGLSAMEIREAGGWKSVVTVDRYVQHRRQMGADAPRSRVIADLTD